MSSQASVVTPQRFQQGLSYAQFMAQAKVNKARFDGFYANFKVQADDAKELQALARRPNGPAKMLALGEDWCGDVVRGLPVLARLAEAAGLEFRIFPRDQNLDIMNEFLNQGRYQSIPVAVFYTKDHKYIGHWIERPEMAKKEVAVIEAAIKKEKPGLNDQEFNQERRARTSARAEAWQQATVQEIKELLKKSVK
ncbi:MAG: thioredoxin family protein [SAR202 cluster bacterium]|nr:thioredoxin family protein [SAR202 cluster bacterium]